MFFFLGLLLLISEGELNFKGSRPDVFFFPHEGLVSSHLSAFCVHEFRLVSISPGSPPAPSAAGRKAVTGLFAGPELQGLDKVPCYLCCSGMRTSVCLHQHRQTLGPGPANSAAPVHVVRADSYCALEMWLLN